jgi:serine/threonine protein kinase
MPDAGRKLARSFGASRLALVDAPLPEKKPRVLFQRCPNCQARADVSTTIAGALVRCARCAVRFEVSRGQTPPPPLPQLPDPEAATVASPAPAAAAKPEAPLPQLDGFTVHQRIGVGGMGEVYRCTRLSDGRSLAVKILSAQMAAVPDYVRRFGREAAAMAQLDHPGIVRILSRGRSAQHCWIAMELVDGVSLRTHVWQNKPSARQLARLLAQVAHALAYAHARAVVHRDLKPDNVLVTPDLRTKVLDFGLAGLHAAGAECLTQTNVAMGTANYMAPEQRKDAKRADHRADLYSFGVMAYELITGELPIGRFPQPSRAVPGLDKGFDAVIERCLEVDPAARPHSALELAHALEALAGLNNAMELAPRTRRKAAKSGIWSWLGLGAGLAVVMGVAALRVSADHSARHPLVEAHARAAVHKPARR